MIQLSVDEAAAYDMLSILSVKSQTRPEVRPDWDRMIVEIIRQVGQERHDQIMVEAYPILWATNSAIFNQIDALNDRHEKAATRLRELAASRSGHSDTQDQVFDLLERWYVLGKPSADRNTQNAKAITSVNDLP